MKKLTVTLLVLVMTATALLPAFSAGAAAKIPIIHIVGEREVEVWNDDGTRYTPTSEKADAIVDEAISELVPVFAKAFLTDNYDEWSRLALEKLTPIYDEIRPAPDGTLPENTGPYIYGDMPAVLPEPASVNLYYKYCWDFRRSPLDEADDLREFIQAVKAKTGSDKVVLSARCGSTSLAASYVYKYGDDDLTKLILISSTLLGTPHADALLGGDITVTGNALYNYLAENDPLSSVNERVAKFVNAMLYSLNVNGSADDTIKLVLRVYDKIKDSFISPFLRSYYAICGNYITSVSDRFEDYLDYIFPTAELKAEYAPIIEKAKEYHYNVQEKIGEMLTDLNDGGVPVCFLAFYGEPNGFPVSERSELVGDKLVDASWQSFGATVAVYPGKLSDGYLDLRKQAGLGRYLSPDGQIDASTCLFPDTTWFIKNMRHEFGVNCLHDFVRQIAWTDGMTVSTNSAYPQFLTVVGNYKSFAPAQAVNERDLDASVYEPDMKNATGFFAKLTAFFLRIVAFFARVFRVIR